MLWKSLSKFVLLFGTFWNLFFLNISNPWLVESTDTEPAEMNGQVCVCVCVCVCVSGVCVHHSTHQYLTFCVYLVLLFSR